MSFDDLKEAAVLARVVERVNQKKSFCGETLLQKSAYFLKELRQVPLSTQFRIYYYGPFSFELRDRLTWMEAMDIVRTNPHEWGATYTVGNRYRQIEQRFPKTLNKYEDDIGWVVDHLAPLTVKQLEPLATALFLKREKQEASNDVLAERLHQIKPHVSVDEAHAALKKVAGWMSQNG
jgi:uncharacterized protein YwgA